MTVLEKGKKKEKEEGEGGWYERKRNDGVEQLWTNLYRMKFASTQVRTIV